MSERVLPWLMLVTVVAYGSYLTATRLWADPTPFVFGGITGLVLGLAWYYVKRLEWRTRERGYREYASHVANTVSLVYLKHGPCPACGHTPPDELADGFSTHAPTCPILAEITNFGKALE